MFLATSMPTEKTGHSGWVEADRAPSLCTFRVLVTNGLSYFCVDRKTDQTGQMSRLI